MIEVKGLVKIFGDKEVLKGIDARFEEGKSNMIIGSSGSGKTVFMKCIVGLFMPERGHILFDGRDFVTMKYGQKKKLHTEIGMLFQNAALFDSMNVEDNVAFPLRLHTKMTKGEILRRVDFCLERVNLGGENKKNPDEISGGMRKRVGIARAIALEPKYLFCDEPNSGLDPLTSQVIDKLIKEITIDLKTTSIINTHDMNSVMEYGDNILYLHKGFKQWSGTPDQIRNTNDAELREFIYAAQFSKDEK